MSTENIFGGWHTLPANVLHDDLTDLWHKLAEQGEGKPNFGMTQRRHEWTMMASLFLRAKPEVILEIGTAQGGTLAGWCQLAYWPCTIIAIDRDLNDCRPRPGNPVHPSIYDGPLAYTSDGGGMAHLARPHQTLYGIQGWSYNEQVFASLHAILMGRKIDWLFHDASHSAEMFAKDFEIYWPLVADGGVFASHDIQPSEHPDCNKSETWAKVVARKDYSACYEFKSRSDDSSMGIGILIK